MTMQYFIEFTDTFSGEANYSWVHRFLVHAKSPTAAIGKVTRRTGYRARKDYDTGDLIRYTVPRCALCYFLTPAQGNETEHYSRLEVI